MGQHDGESVPSGGMGQQNGLPSVHALAGTSAFASPSAPPGTCPTNSTEHHDASVPLASQFSQPWSQLGPQRPSSTGISTHAASPLHTRMTSDTAKSHHSVESVPASEIQWLLQAMGSAMDSTRILPRDTSNGAHHSTDATWAPPSLVTPRNISSAQPGANDAEVQGTPGHRCESRAASTTADGAGPGEGEKLKLAAAKGLHVAADEVLCWDVEQQQASDRRCEDLLLEILQETSKVDADVEVNKPSTDCAVG